MGRPPRASGMRDIRLRHVESETDNWYSSKYGFAHKVLTNADITVKGYFVVRLYGQDLPAGLVTRAWVFLAAQDC